MKLAAALLVVTLALAFVPNVADARPDCLQVYPWSELCQGDLGGFFGGFCVRGAGQTICPLVCLDPRALCQILP